MMVRRGRKAKRTESLTWRDIVDVCACVTHWLWRLLCLVRYLNPLFHLAPRHRQFYAPSADGSGLIKPSLWERTVSIFQSDATSRARLLAWCQDQIPTRNVNNLGTCWQDGVSLCALMESTCPGACPRYDLLRPQHKVNNCRLGLRLGNKHLGIPLTIANADDIALLRSEIKLRRVLYLIKWASKRENTPYRKGKAILQPDGSHSTAASCALAKGRGLFAGVVNKMCKFNVSIPPNQRLDLRIKIEGPQGQGCDELITSRFSRMTITNTAATSPHDCPENPYSDSVARAASLFTAVLKIKGDSGSFINAASETSLLSKKIPFDYQCVGEGQIVMNYIPHTAGRHRIAVLWQGEHIHGSPFISSIEESVERFSDKTNCRVRQKRVSISSHSRIQYYPNEHTPSTDQAGDKLLTNEFQANANLCRFATASKIHYRLTKQATITRRRVLKKVMKKAGREIVIEEAVTDTSREDSQESTDRETITEGAADPRPVTERANVEGVTENKTTDNKSSTNMSTVKHVEALSNNQKERKMNSKEMVSRAIMKRGKIDKNDTGSRSSMPSYDIGINGINKSFNTSYGHVLEPDVMASESSDAPGNEDFANENQYRNVDKISLHALYSSKDYCFENGHSCGSAENEISQASHNLRTLTSVPQSNKNENVITVGRYDRYKTIQDKPKSVNIISSSTTERFILSIVTDIVNNAMPTASRVNIHGTDEYNKSKYSTQSKTSSKKEKGLFLGGPTAAFRPVMQAYPAQITDRNVCIQRPTVRNPHTNHLPPEQKSPLLDLPTSLTSDVWTVDSQAENQSSVTSEFKTTDTHHAEQRLAQDSQVSATKSVIREFYPSNLRHNTLVKSTEQIRNARMKGPLFDSSKDGNTSVRLLQSDNLHKSSLFVSRHPAIEESSALSLSSAIDHDLDEEKMDSTALKQPSKRSTHQYTKQKAKDKLRPSLSLPALSSKWKAFEIDLEEEGNVINLDEMEMFATLNKQKRCTLGDTDLANSIGEFASLQKGISEFQTSKLQEGTHKSRSINKHLAHSYSCINQSSLNYPHSDSKSHNDIKLDKETDQELKRVSESAVGNVTNKTTHYLSDNKTPQHLFTNQRVKSCDITTQVSASEIKAETGWTRPKAYVRQRIRKVWDGDMTKPDAERENDHKEYCNSDGGFKQSENTDSLNLNSNSLVREATCESASDSGITDDSSGHITKPETTLHTTKISHLSQEVTLLRAASSTSRESGETDSTHINSHRILTRHTQHGRLKKTAQLYVSTSLNSSQAEGMKNTSHDHTGTGGNLQNSSNIKGNKSSIMHSGWIHSSNQTTKNLIIANVKPNDFSVSKNMASAPSFEHFYENGEQLLTHDERRGSNNNTNHPALINSIAARTSYTHGWISPTNRDSCDVSFDDGVKSCDFKIQQLSPTERKTSICSCTGRICNLLGRPGNIPKSPTPTESHRKQNSDFLLRRDDSSAGYETFPEKRKHFLYDLNKLTCITKESQIMLPHGSAPMVKVDKEHFDWEIPAENIVAKWICQNPDILGGLFQKNHDRSSIDDDHIKDTNEYMNDAWDCVPAIPKAQNCHAFGPGLNHGFVGMINNFQVRVDGAGNGDLTVGVHGPYPHAVTEINIIFTSDNLYEILYEVTRPGHYIITVKWSEMNIPNSPFLCKVTY